MTAWRRVVLMLALGIVCGWGAKVLAQSTSVSFNVLHGDITQWGTSAVTAATALTDALANPTAPLVGSTNLLWDTTQWTRWKTAALATFTPATTLTSRNIVGAAIVEKSSRWEVVSTPAVSNQATASIAAEANVRHVADCATFSAASTSAPVLTRLTINLRDGATGAGTIIHSWTVAIAAATGQNVAPISFCGLNLVGTTNTAMTLEYSALLTNLFEDVTLTGYNLQ